MILIGDAYQYLATLTSKSVQCVVTSPPYWGLRDYGADGQLGLERTPQEYVANMRMIFEQVWRVLKDDGTLWLNLGDSYAGSWGNQSRPGHRGKQRAITKEQIQNFKPYGNLKNATKTGSLERTPGLKGKDLVGTPWRVAFALQEDGWYLRQDIIWHKPNPMPESVRDRCTKSHEYIFLLSKSPKYLFNQESILEPFSTADHKGKTRERGITPLTAMKQDRSNSGGFTKNREGRNKRSVWSVCPKPFKGAHFATFPPDLIEPCILAGSNEGDTVLDPFFGAGTTGLVAKKHNRKFIGIEINESYAEMAKKRIWG